MNRIKKYTYINNKKVPFISGGKGCFVAGTKIAVPNGYKHIEDMECGDTILCFDDRGIQRSSKVIATHIHQKEKIVSPHSISSMCLCPLGTAILVPATKQPLPPEI